MSLYLIEQDFGKSGREITGDPEYTRSKIVDCICKGEWLPHLVRVIEIKPSDDHWNTWSGRWIDVTEDIAQEVYELALEEDFGRMSRPVRDFVERHGVVVMQAAE